VHDEHVERPRPDAFDPAQLDVAGGAGLGRLSHDQVRFEDDLAVPVGVARRDLVDEQLRRRLAQLRPRLLLEQAQITPAGR